MKLSVRLDHEAAECIARWHWKYHHTGIPTTAIMPGEIHIPHLGMYVSGFSTSPFGIEWMRFEQGSPVHPLVQRVPHVAFEVRDLEQGTAPTRFYYSDAAHTAFQRRARCHDRTQRRACGTHRIFPTVSAATG